MRALLIVNPHATGTTARRRDLLIHALAGELQLRVMHTEGRGHAAYLAAEAAAAGAELVVVHAGDGTVNEVVNGLLLRGIRPEAPMLAVVPGGSTNVFARAVGVDRDPTSATEQIIEALSAGRWKTVSLGQADDRYFLFNAGLGIDAEVVKEVERRRARGIAISQALHLRMTVLRFFRSDRRQGRLDIDLPGRPPVEGAFMVFVSNVDPWTYVGARPVRTNPGTTPGGGLGVFALTRFGLFTVLRVSRQILARAADPHSSSLVRLDDEATLRVRSRRPVGLQVDGDYLGERSVVTFRSVPDALRVVV